MSKSDKYIDYGIIFLCALIGLLFLEFRDFVYFRDYSIIFEGAYRLSLGQIPFRDFGVPVGPVSFLIPAIFFKVFEPNWTYFIWSQQFQNIVQLILIYCIFSKLQTSLMVKRGSVLLYSLLYLTFLSHPWYNISGWTMMLAAGLCALGSVRVSFVFAGLFTGLAFLAKQDFGILTFVVAVTFISAKSIGFKSNFNFESLKDKKTILNLALNLINFALPALLVTFVFVCATDVEKFSYWFNYGQEPHKHRSLNLGALLGVAFGFVLVLVGVVFKSFPVFVAAVFTTAALITNGVSGLFFTHYYYVGFLPILIVELWQLRGKLYLRLPVLIILGAMLLTGPLRNFYYILEAVVLNEPEPFNFNYRNLSIPVKKIPSELHAFNGVMAPQQTIDAILELKRLKGKWDASHQNERNLRVLNISELTPIYTELDIPPPLSFPLWFHTNISLFSNEIGEINSILLDGYYDIVLLQGTHEGFSRVYKEFKFNIDSSESYQLLEKVSETPTNATCKNKCDGDLYIYISRRMEYLL